jgi:hypothetical protein
MANSEKSPQTPPAIRLPVERGHALIRGLWRLLCAVLLGGFVFIAWPNWQLLWLTQKAICLAMAMILLCAAAIALALALVAFRWLLLACWNGPLGIEITPQTITMRLGPFGSRHVDWTRLRIELDADIDRDLFDLMPDDAFVPKIRNLDSGEDLAGSILKFARVSHEEFTRALRPYLGNRYKE